jgi:hypothetical protein
LLIYLNTFAVTPNLNLNLNLMKKTIQKLTMVTCVIALFATAFTLNSCKKSSDTTTTPTVIILDGFYVKGPATAFADFNSKALMKVAKNEVNSLDLPSMVELYIPIKAGAGFNIVKVAGATKIVYGPGTDFATITKGTTDEPRFPFQRGSAAVTATTFTVPTDGMYHVVYNDSLNRVAVIPVHWGLIGAATPGGWSNDTMMTESAFNLNTMSWSLTGLKLLKGDWKYRYSHGWKVEIDTTNSDKTKWVKVNTNFGTAVDGLVAGGANITNASAGIYNATMTYTLGSGYTATLVKTSDIPPIDYSAFQMGIIGNVYKKLDGTQANWDENFGTSLPTKVGTNYTWKYIIAIDTVGDFKFRQGNDWSGKSIGFPDVVMAGPDASHFTNDATNFKVDLAGMYTIVLLIDATNEIYTVTATKTGKK